MEFMFHNLPDFCWGFWMFVSTLATLD